MTNTGNDTWELKIMAAWPTYVQLNVFGFDSFFYGDTDGDGVMSRLPPNSDTPNFLSISAPPSPHLSWTLVLKDQMLQWSLHPAGKTIFGVVMYAFLLSFPFITGTFAVLISMSLFLGIQYNKYGMKPNISYTSYSPISSHGNKSTGVQKLEEARL